MKINNLVFVAHSTQHHSAFSGYSKVLNQVHGKVISGLDRSWMPYQWRKSITRRLNKGSGIYDSISLQKEFEVIAEVVMHGRGMVHFLNGERDIRYSTYFKRLRGWSFISTFHKPPSVLKEMLTNLKYIHRLDGAIAVGTNQLEHLSKVFGIGQVRFIPHGVDTDFFVPDETKRQPRTAIFVGYHLRDFHQLNEVSRQVIRKYPDFKLHVVVDEPTSLGLIKLPQVTFHSQITDPELLDLYQRASLLLMPLKDVTACNSILESLACGLPIVTTRLEGHHGYLSDECARQIEPGNAMKMADTIIELLENEELNKKMSNASRAHSLNFSWPRIGSQLIQFYQNFQ